MDSIFKDKAEEEGASITKDTSGISNKTAKARP
jgi:hypothetical protein